MPASPVLMFLNCSRPSETVDCSSSEPFNSLFHFIFGLGLPLNEHWKAVDSVSFPAFQWLLCLLFLLWVRCSPLIQQCPSYLSFHSFQDVPQDLCLHFSQVSLSYLSVQVDQEGLVAHKDWYNRLVDIILVGHSTKVCSSSVILATKFYLLWRFWSRQHHACFCRI